MNKVKSFNNFITENLSNDKTYRALIDACMNILDRWNDYVEWDAALSDSVQFHIRFDEDNVIKGVEVTDGRETAIVDIGGISFTIYVYGKPAHVEMYDAEEMLPITFDQIVDKEGFIGLLQFED